MIICVTGKHGSGKTSVAKLLGLKIIDADKIGKKVFKEKKEEIRKLFGTTDKKQIREKIFSNKNLLLKFNRIMHPEMTARIEGEIERKKGRNLVVDAALYYDLKLDKICNKVILVIRNKYKVMKELGESREDVEKIVKNQKMPKEPNFVIVNNKDKKELKKRVGEVKKAFGL